MTCSPEVTELGIPVRMLLPLQGLGVGLPG